MGAQPSIAYSRRNGKLELTEENEHASRAEDGVRELLMAIGLDPSSDGLSDTPARVVKAIGEMTAGYLQDPGEILARTFEVACDEMVVVDGIEFTSLCEHHLLPFVGEAKVAYVPGAKVVGLSKLARLVECFALRLQVQERLTQQIANAMNEHLSPRSVGVVIRAEHQCMACRGVRKRATMITSALLGDLKTDAAMRAEFMALR